MLPLHYLPPVHGVRTRPDLVVVLGKNISATKRIVHIKLIRRLQTHSRAAWLLITLPRALMDAPLRIEDTSTVLHASYVSEHYAQTLT